jgi:hypothetical protein
MSVVICKGKRMMTSFENRVVAGKPRGGWRFLA